MLRVDLRGAQDVRNYIDSLKLTPPKRKQLHRALARKVAGFTRKNVRQQKSPDGAGFKARSPGDPAYDDGKKRGKMLQRIAKEKHMKAIGEDTFGKVYWSDGLMGAIAKRQQEGARFAIDPERSRKRRERGGAGGWGNDPATKRQAMRLLQLGFRARVKGKGYLKVSPLWIRKNLTINKAGFLIRLLDDEPRATAVNVVLPARPFLGVSPQENAQLRDIITDLLIRYR